MQDARTRILRIIPLLEKEYGAPKTALAYRSPFQLLVATILSAQCTDVRVNKVTSVLFKKYATPSDFAKVRQPVLEKEIRSTGFFRNKAKNIIASSKKIARDFHGKVPDTMESLVGLPGVARKTANIVLSSAFKKAEGIAVDTHVRRLSQRLGFSQSDDPVKIEQDLMRIVPKEKWLSFNYLLVEHGRRVCQAKKPLHEECAVKGLCPFYKTL
jgi:endonuclease-3